MQCSLRDGRDAFHSGSYSTGFRRNDINDVCRGLWDFVDLVELVATLTLFSPQLPPGAASSPETIQIHANTSHRHLVVLTDRAEMLQIHADVHDELLMTA